VTKGPLSGPFGFRFVRPGRGIEKAPGQTGELSSGWGGPRAAGFSDRYHSSCNIPHNPHARKTQIPKQLPRRNPTPRQGP